MAQRVSGYARKEDECYETPGWVAEVLVPHLPRKPKRVFEPASGSGRMVQALAGAFGPSVHIMFNDYTRDVDKGFDFLVGKPGEGLVVQFDSIITNPPYGFGGRLALSFIERSLQIMGPPINGMVAMLLKVDFDSAKGRAHIFGDHQAWGKKLVLRRRIMWFPSETGCGPSENHAWYIWDWRHSGPPTIAYGP